MSVICLYYGALDPQSSIPLMRRRRRRLTSRPSSETLRCSPHDSRIEFGVDEELGLEVKESEVGQTGERIKRASYAPAWIEDYDMTRI